MVHTVNDLLMRWPVALAGRRWKSNRCPKYSTNVQSRYPEANATIMEMKCNFSATPVQRQQEDKSERERLGLLCCEADRMREAQAEQLRFKRLRFRHAVHRAHHRGKARHLACRMKPVDHQVMRFLASMRKKYGLAIFVYNNKTHSVLRVSSTEQFNASDTKKKELTPLSPRPRGPAPRDQQLSPRRKTITIQTYSHFKREKG